VAGEDGVTEHVGTVTDVTEQREAEEALRESENRFRGFVTASTDAVFRANADWTELRLLTGRFAGDAPEAVDAWLARFVHPDDRARVAERIAHAIRTKSAFELEYRVVRDGVTAWTFSRAIPVLDDRGEIIGWFGAASDVTRRREAEDAREALLGAAESARAEAERANRAKDEFLATVSHELRSPLQGILGWLALLKRGQLAAEQTTRAIDAVERSVRLQAQLVHDIMDVSRIVAGRVELERAPVDLTALLGQTADEFMPAAVAKRIQLDLSIGDCAVVVGDRERLHQVFSNLVANALKFTPAGGRVVLSCECDRDAAVVTVHDTGEGIAPEFLPRLFDRFTQADTSITRRHGGLGLGLAIVRHLVDLHGGTVTADSLGRGKGATFRVHLPVALTEVSPHAHGSVAALPRLDGVEILLVEDDRDALDAMTHALRWTGATVRAATSAREAWAAFAGNAPDVVVSDLSMPDEDGYSLLRRIKTAARSVPAIALTGFTRAEDKARVLKAGFAAYVAKPIDPDELARVVATVVGDTGSRPTGPSR
jgi:PAS domain S-box-containing protein